MANNRIAYGLAKEAGIDTKGMSPAEVWEALKKKGITVKTPNEVLKEYENLTADELKAVILGKQEKAASSEGKVSGIRAKRNAFQEKLKDAPNGTYDYDTGEAVSFEGQKMYQVSFQTTDSEDETSAGYLTDNEYDAVVNRLSEETGSKPYLGKFEVSETSFACNSLTQALEIAKAYNQFSIWDWEKMREVPNPFWDKTKNSVK